MVLEPGLVREAPPGTSEAAGRKAAEAIVDDTVNAVRKARGR